MTARELVEELRILDPDPEMPVQADGQTGLELSIVHGKDGDFLNLGVAAEVDTND